MNSLILHNDSGIISDPKILRHLHETLKAKKGDVFKCTILNEALALGTVLFLNENECHLNIFEKKPYEKGWFNLVVGVSRPQTTKKIMEHGTTFGANSIHFFQADLSEKSYLASKVFKEYEDFLKAGLSQSSIYGELPPVFLHHKNPASQYGELSQKFILDLSAKENFGTFVQNSPIDFSLPITLAIGPERGFSPKEIAAFHGAGFIGIKISASILRVEHAIYSAISQLELLKGNTK